MSGVAGWCRRLGAAPARPRQAPVRKRMGDPCGRMCGRAWSRQLFHAGISCRQHAGPMSPRRNPERHTRTSGWNKDKRIDSDCPSANQEFLNWWRARGSRGAVSERQRRKGAQPRIRPGVGTARAYAALGLRGRYGLSDLGDGHGLLLAVDTGSAAAITARRPARGPARWPRGCFELAAVHRFQVRPLATARLATASHPVVG